MLAAFAGDPLQDGVRVGVAGVGEGVGDEDDPVGGALAQTLDGLFVAGLDAGAEVGGVLDLQLGDGVVDLVAVAVEAGHGQDGLGLVAEGDERDRVVVAQPVRHHGEGLLGEVQAARFGHGAGDVDDEGEGGGRAFAGAFRGAGGEADADQGPVLVVGAGAVDGDRETVAVRAFVVLAEAVDELLGADRRGVGEPAVGEGAAGVVVGGGVDVEGEGGEVAGVLPAVVLLLAGFVAVRGCGQARAVAVAVGRLAVFAGAGASAARGEQESARRRDGEQQVSCPVPLHRPCPLGPLVSASCDCDGAGGENVRYGVLRKRLEAATETGRRDR